MGRYCTFGGPGDSVEIKLSGLLAQAVFNVIGGRAQDAVVDLDYNEVSRVLTEYLTLLKVPAFGIQISANRFTFETDARKTRLLGEWLLEHNSSQTLVFA